MLAFLVMLKSGAYYTVRASEMRFGGGGIELWVVPKSAFDSPAPQIVALFNAHDVEAIVAKDFLVPDETRAPGTEEPRVVHRGHAGPVMGDDVIPF